MYVSVSISIFVLFQMNTQSNDAKLIKDFTFDQDLSNFVVQAHNDFRRKILHGRIKNQPKARTMEPMIWDDILASKAKQWADKCILSRTSKLYINDNQEATKKNNKIKNRTLNYGENIFIAPLFNPIEEQDQLKSVVYKTMEQWFGEYIYFKYPDKCRKNKYCGHYTQLVWSSTSKVGCAISQCLTDQKTSDSRFFLAYTMACFYDPPGNQAMKKPYET